MMAQSKRPRRSEAREPEFYEVLPYAQGAPYQEGAADDKPPDHDLAPIEDTGRRMALWTLVVLAVVTVLICLLLVWGVEAARGVVPRSSGTYPGL